MSLPQCVREEEEAFVAAQKGDCDELLIGSYMDNQSPLDTGVFVYDEDGLTTLHIAAKHGNNNTVRTLVERCGFNVHVHAEFAQETPLQVAINNNQLETAELLIELGSDVNHMPEPADIHEDADDFRVTALRDAVWLDDEDVALPFVKLLCDHGANPFLVDHSNLNVFFRAVGNDFTACLDILIEQGRKILMEKGEELAEDDPVLDVNAMANANNTSKEALTMYHLAAQNDACKALQWLRARGADSTITVRGGWTPLHVAAACNSLGFCRELLEPLDASHTVADIDATRDNGETPLVNAIAFSGSIPTVKYLLERGANPATHVRGPGLFNMVTQRASMVSKKKLRTCRYLLNRFLLMEAGDSHPSPFFRDDPCKQLTMDLHGYPDTEEMENESIDSLFTPLVTAASAGDVLSMELFLEYGADVNQRGCVRYIHPDEHGRPIVYFQGMSALLCAAEAHNSAMLALLLNCPTPSGSSSSSSSTSSDNDDEASDSEADLAVSAAPLATLALQHQPQRPIDAHVCSEVPPDDDGESDPKTVPCLSALQHFRSPCLDDSDEDGGDAPYWTQAICEAGTASSMFDLKL